MQFKRWNIWFHPLLSNAAPLLSTRYTKSVIARNVFRRYRLTSRSTDMTVSSAARGGLTLKITRTQEQIHQQFIWGKNNVHKQILISECKLQHIDIMYKGRRLYIHGLSPSSSRYDVQVSLNKPQMLLLSIICHQCTILNGWMRQYLALIVGKALYKYCPFTISSCGIYRGRRRTGWHSGWLIKVLVKSDVSRNLGKREKWI